MIQLKRKRWLSTLVILSFLLAECNEALQKDRPIASGEANTIIIVADQEVWKGSLGDTIRSYYAAPYLILPQPEPIFDLQYLTPQQYQTSAVRREASAYLIVANLSITTSPAAKLVINAIGEENVRRAKTDPTYNSAIVRDKYAKGQLIAYQFAYSEAALLTNIGKNFPATAEKFRRADQKKLESFLFSVGENRKVADDVQRILGVKMRIPKTYVLASKKDSVIWLRQETGKLSSNIIIKKLPLSDVSQFNKAGIIAIQDSIGRKYLSSQLSNTYMYISETDLPLFVDTITVNKREVLEVRGIWKMKNDYMSGAFISYLFYNPQEKVLLFVNGFIHAPGEPKRSWMQKLEYILKSVNF